MYRGMRTVILENQMLRVTVLVDKGTDIIEFLHKPTDTDFMWKAPQGVRNPSLLVPTTPRSSGAFLDFYEGGWQEIFPSGGDACTYKGVEFGVHGETCLMPWELELLEDRPERVAIRVWVRTYRTPFLLEKVLSLESDRPVLSIAEKAVNEGEEAMELMWGHHPAFGAPFLDESCVVDVRSARMLTRNLGGRSRVADGDGFDWPHGADMSGGKVDFSRMPPPSAKTHDWACLHDLSEGWYAITNMRRGVGFGMWFPKEVFRYLWIWQCAGAVYGPPFFGRAYTLAIEPWTTYPDNLAKASEAGTALKLGSGASLDIEMKAVGYVCDGRIAGVLPDGRVVPA
jgi:hypothetical protein